jgi:hypothetical protein
VYLDKLALLAGELVRVVHTDLLLHLELIIDGIIDVLVRINLIDPIEFALILNVA